MDTEHDAPDDRLADAIRGLSDREPENDLWPGIAQVIAQPRAGMRVTWPTAIAAGLALLLAGGIMGRQLGPDGPAATGATVALPPSESVTLPAGFDRAEESLSAAIAELQRAYHQVAPRLDPATRQSIAASVATIDSAIGDARRRVGASPDDIDAARYLTRTMQRKLRVLETAATMATRS